MNNISELAKSMVDNLEYPYKIFAKETSYDEIMNAYKASYEKGKDEGFTPVLIPVDDTLADYFEIMKNDNYSVEKILNADVKSGKEILDERFKEYFYDYNEDYEMGMEEFIGEYNDEPEEISDCTSILDYSTNNTLETILFEVPTAKPWELVAYIPFGGWNECPYMDEMTAICKYWYEKYSAVPVTITHDTLEMYVPVPVGEEHALELAKEHYAFTPDRVDQCTRTGTLSEVSASLAVSNIWFFWWD